MGVRLADHIDPRLVMADVEVDGMEGLFQLVGARVAAAWPDVSPEQLIDRLVEREKSSSTGLEGGLAIPHATVDGLPGSLCVIVRPAQPIPMPQPEMEPVGLVFLLLSPPQGLGLHVRLLARLARLCATPGFIEQLLSSADSDALRWAVVEEDGRHV